MSIRNKMVAFAATLLLMVGGRSEASFTYSATPSASSFAFGTASTLAVTGASSSTVQSGETIIATMNLGLTTTASPAATDTGIVNVVDTVVITPTTGGTLTLTVNDAIQFFRSDTGGEVSTATITGGTLTGTAGGFTYTIQSIQYQGPSVGSTPGAPGAGGISYIINEVASPAVPEPASLAMVVIGLGGVFAVRRFRRRTA